MTLDHNGMVLPLAGYTFRGVVWYQGESDVHFGTSYYKATLPALIAEWRSQFGDPSLPFLIVQLPGYGPTPWSPRRQPGRICAAPSDRRHSRIRTPPSP